MKPRLLFVVNVDWFFLSHRLPIALAAQSAGYEIHIATKLTQPIEKITSYGFHVHELQIQRSGQNPLSALRLFYSLKTLFKTLKPDIVHLVTIKPLLIGGLAARFTGVPAVIAAVSGLGHVFSSTGIKATLRKSIATLLYRLALNHQNIAVIFQNEDDKRLIQKYANLTPQKINLIKGSGVNLEQFAYSPQPSSHKILVLLPARMLADKGVREFSEAAERLCCTPNLKFILVGGLDPKNPSSLSQKEIEQWVSAGILQWWGHRRDMHAIFSICHIVVLPSYREGLSKSLIEAAASGRPVITTDTPGCRDAIIPGKTGLLVPAKDTDALTNAIEMLVKNENLRKKMGLAARQFAEQNFNIENVVEKHLAIYNGMIK